MRVLRVEMAGITTSFRHPHFLMGRQPSYPLPPPATILGHVASALGEWPDPNKVRFAYSFSHRGRMDDMENIYFTEVGGSIPREQQRRWPYQVNVSGTMNPVLRDVLFEPTLTLYLDAPELLDNLHEAFRSPKYMVVLGRSQDLAAYRHVDLIETEDADRGYLQGTLVRASERQRFRIGVTMIMPRYIDPDSRTSVMWSPYLILDGTSFIVPAEQMETGSMWVAAEADERFTVDPDSPPTSRGLRRVLYWHTFVPHEELAFESGTSS